MFGGGGPSEQQSSRKAVVACQVCGQDQTLTEEKSDDHANGFAEAAELFIMECCFSIVCKDCVGVGGQAAQSNNADPATPAEETKSGQDESDGIEQKPAESNKRAPAPRICLACLEPVTSGGASGGKQVLSFARNSVLVSLLASINEAHKQAAASKQDSSSIFNFITGGSARVQDTMCHRCQEKEQRFECQTCSGSDIAAPTKLCQDCNTLIHSLGAFKAHKVRESVAQVQQLDVDEEQRQLLSVLTQLEECPRHSQPIEFYDAEELAEDATFELSGVSYGCQRCISTTESAFTKIDKDNLLNVYSLKQELFKERQKSLTTLNSMLSTFNLDIVEKLPQVRALEIAQVRDVIARLVKTLYNKQGELEQQIEHRFAKLTDFVHKEKQRMLTKKEVVERNYNLLERALDVVPLQILSCEEDLLSVMLEANQGLMRVVRTQETKIIQRQALYTQSGEQTAMDTSSEATDLKLEPPFHMIDPEQQKNRLQTLEQFASRVDEVVSQLFRHASDQIEKKQELPPTNPQSLQALSSHQPYPSVHQQKSMPNLLLSQSGPHFRPGAGNLEAASVQAYQTASLTNAQPQQSLDGMGSDGVVAVGETQISPAFVRSLTEGGAGNGDHLRGLAGKSGVLSAFVTQQNQAKSRMIQKDAAAKSQLSISKNMVGASNSLDITPEAAKSNKAEQRSSKGGTSRRDQSYQAKTIGELGARGSSQSATAAHQAYAQSGSNRYSNNPLSKSTAGGLKSATTKWDASTRVGKARDASVSSQNAAGQGGGGQSVTRNSSYLAQGKDRSVNRASATLVAGSRSGAHSTVGQSERWTANVAGKRSSNLNISQDVGGDFANQKNQAADGSPRVSQKRISMSNLAPNNKENRVQVSEPEKQVIKDNMAEIEQDCLAPRVFTHVAQTSTAIQVAWSHPSNFQKVITSADEHGQLVQRKQHIQYVLEYGIGVKVDNKEQFRQIYKGKAHKCIITDLMPRTTFRLRVAPILNSEKQAQGGEYDTKPVASQEQGIWSEVTNITTKETQTFDVGGVLSAHSPKAPNLMCAQLVTKGRKRWLAFDKAGQILAAYGYSFGEHLWCLKIQYQESQNLQRLEGGGTASSALDQYGSMVVGVVNKRFSTTKMFGSVINYSLFKGEIVVKVYLDSNKKRLIIYHPQHPEGETYTDLPKDGLFYPAVQNKTPVQKHKSSLKVFFKFDQLIPKDKAEIGTNLLYSSDDGGDAMTDDLSQSASLLGGALSTNNSMVAAQSKEESKRAADHLARRATYKATSTTEKMTTGGAAAAASTPTGMQGQARPTSSSRFSHPGALSTNPATRYAQNIKESQITQNNAQAD